MKKFLFTLGLCACLATCFAQYKDTSTVHRLISKANSWIDTYASEKIYLHFDKPVYAAGDTAWIKAYLLAGNGSRPSGHSAKLYIEVINQDKGLLTQVVLPVVNGQAQGYIPFDSRKTSDGNYTVRAYTNWLQNFGADYFFYKQLSIGSIGPKTWLLSEQHQTGKGPDSGKVQMVLDLKDAKGQPVIARDVTIRVLDNGKTILKSEQTTSVDGSLKGSFALPEKVSHKNLSVVVEDKLDKNQRAAFPFYPAGRGAEVDLQFMPESGVLVAGLLSKVGFKAIGADGLGVDVAGVVVDSKGEEVAVLQNSHNGMGSFVLVPQATETYTARVSVAGIMRSYRLPVVKTAGLSLRADGVNHADEVYVYITSAGLMPGQKYLLVAQGRDHVYFGSEFNLGQEGFFNTRIPKSKFKTGIVNLVIMDAANKPVCSRSVFVDRRDALKVSAIATQTAYSPMDSIALNINVNDASGKPVQGSFSLSVTDDSQIKDAGAQSNIAVHMLLTAELKGHVEQPAWYFTTGDEKTKLQALDNLLLTQGWVGYNWQPVASVPPPAFKPENSNDISGKLTGMFGPAKNVKVMLLSKSKTANEVTDTVSNDKGRFLFKDLPYIDSVSYVIKLHNNNGKSKAASIEVDDFRPTTAALPYKLRTAPWNFNTDTTLLKYFNGNKAANALPFTVTGGGKVLKQVDISAKRVVRVISGEFAVEIGKLTEADLIAAKKESLMDLLYKKFSAFKETRNYAPSLIKRVAIQSQVAFVYGSQKIQSIIADGQDIGDPTSRIGMEATDPDVGSLSNKDPAGVASSNKSDFQSDVISNYEVMKTFLIGLGADDVKGISFFRGPNYINLVITTRSGKGAYASTSYGTYVYRPLPIELPKEFYAPKYKVKSPVVADYRSTIHWEPNVITDAAGYAKVSFYAADKPSTYTVVLEGTDMAGHFGVAAQKITVSKGSAQEK